MAALPAWTRSRRLWLVLGGLLVLYALVGFLVAPRIVERVILDQAQERLERVPTIGKVRVNPFALSLTIEDFALPDRPGSTLLAFDRFYANAQASSLFRWAGTLRALEVERPYVGLRRFEDGQINVLEVWEDFKRLSPPKEEGADDSLPRALFQEIRVSGGRLEAEDRAAAAGPKLWEWGPAEVSLHDISTIPDAEGDDELTLGLPDGGTLQLTGSLVVEPFRTEGTVVLENAQLTNAWRAVTEKFGLELESGNLSARVRFIATLEDDGPHLQIDEAEGEVTGLRVADVDSGEEVARLDSARLTGLSASWPEQVVEAGSIVVDGAFAQAWLEPDGTGSWEAWVPEPTRKQAVETYEYVAERVEFDASLGRFELRNASAAFEDRTFTEPQRFLVEDSALTLTDVSTDPDQDWGLEATATLEGDALAEARGKVDLAPMVLETEVKLENLDLPRFQPYVERLLPLQLLGGVLETSGTVRLSLGGAPATEDESSTGETTNREVASAGEGKITFEGALSLADFELAETVTGGPLARWASLEVEGARATLLPISLEAERVSLSEAGLEISRSEDGEFNLLRLVDALGNDGTDEERSEADSAAGGFPPVRIARLELHDCFGRYWSAAGVQPFERTVKSVNGTIEHIATDRAEGAELEIEAVVDSGGLVALAGQIDPFDYQRLAVLELDLTDVLLPPQSPMSIQATGFPIEKGLITIASEVEVHDRQLESDHHLEIDRLALGEKVEGGGDLGVPVKLGVSLLKDKNGRITLDIPIEGDLANPEFVLVSAIRGAAFDLVGEAAKAPFRILARLGGGSDDTELDLIEFSSGSAELGSAARANLETLARALEEKPELALEITGAIADSDRLGLRARALAEELGVEVAENAPVEELERVFQERLSSEELEALRAKMISESPEAELDESTYREALGAVLVEGQPVDDSLLAELGPQRAEAIRAFLVDEGGVDPSRLTILPETVEIESDDGDVGCLLAVTVE